MLRAFNISPLVLCSAVALLIVGELATGTSVYFVAMMAITLLSAGVTYNFLGGLSTISGILYADFAIRTIVVSQFAKVLLFEAADKSIEAPDLTISVYAVFYLSAMVGVLLFGKTRIRLPRPMESLTSAQSRLLYVISLAVGLVASVVFEVYSQAYGEDTQYNSERSMGLAFSPLLLFSLVIAVDSRIRSTEKRHSASIAVMVPLAVSALFGFIDTVRWKMALPFAVYIATCYLRGYKFKLRHYVACGLGLAVFSYFIVPFAAFTRDATREKPLVERARIVFNMLGTHHDVRELRSGLDLATKATSASREQYFSTPGANFLSRLSMIRSDSNLINACSKGFHYGLTAIWIDAAQSIPSFIYKDKSHDTAGADYIGRISGISADVHGVSHPAITAVGDSFGAFGWPGVILFPLFCFPIMFVVYESMFDLSKPWGTVALGTSVVLFGEVTLYRFLPFTIRAPLVLVLLSYLVGGLARALPNRGERAIGQRVESIGLGDD